jgi:hypothetical protein
MVIWYILWLFGIFYGYLVCLPRFGTLYQEKSGIPATVRKEAEFEVSDFGETRFF